MKPIVRHGPLIVCIAMVSAAILPWLFTFETTKIRVLVLAKASYAVMLFYDLVSS